MRFWFSCCKSSGSFCLHCWNVGAGTIFANAPLSSTCLPLLLLLPWLAVFLLQLCCPCWHGSFGSRFLMAAALAAMLL
jgi:hypothetical protein